MLFDERIEALLEKYVKDNTVVSFGTGPTNEVFIKKLALYIESNSLNLKVVPTSHSMGMLCSQLKLKTVSMDDYDIDLAFDFVDQVDEDFNYISNETTSLIRDKMIAQDTAELVIICEEKDFVKRLNKKICVEVSPFAVKKTILQLMNLGEAGLVTVKEKPMISETGNFFVELAFDEVFSLEDIDYQAKKIPGVLETSLFLGYADRVVLHGTQLIVKSRMTNPDF